MTVMTGQDSRPQGSIAEDRLKTLVEVGMLLTSELSLDGVLQGLAEHSARLIGARYAAIGVLDAGGTELEAFHTSGLTPEERERIGPLPRGHGILGVLIREPRLLRLPDLAKHPDTYGFPPNHPPMKSFLGAPIVSRRGVFGNIYLTEKIGGDEFTQEDEDLLVMLASQAAAAVDNARTHDESARLLEEVQTLHRSRERFFAMVNHELRNALTGTFGWAEMLVRKKDPATVPRAAYEVLDAAGQAVSLINDLLDLSRLDEDRLKPVMRALDPAMLLRRTVGRVVPAAENKQVTLTTEVGNGVTHIATDATRVEQILVNLLTNAIRHSPDRATVRIALVQNESWLAFRVWNQGPPIPSDEAERLFDIYVTHAAEESRGSGLGLPLSRRLARLLGGELQLLPGDHAGICFQLELPVAKRET